MRQFILVLFCLSFSVCSWAIVPTHDVADDVDDELLKQAELAKKEQIDPTRWLFVIGVGKYDAADDVVYSERSATAFETIARKKLGISARRTVSLIGDQASSGRIRDRLYQLVDEVKQGDTIYFYYSGHGIPNIKTREAYILPKDRTPNSIVRDDFFKLENIYKQLNDSAAGKVVAIVDSCFSGSTDNKSLYEGVAAARLKPKKVKLNETKMVVITAGKDDQFSNMYKEKRHRAFSYFVMKSILNDVKNIKEMYRFVKENVEEVTYELGNVYLQTPTIEGDINHRF